MTETNAPALAPSTTRRLATVETITDIGPITNADAIVRVRVRGWDLVARLDEFQVGDPCVYFEVDTLVDVTDPRLAFLAPRGLRTDSDGNTGHVLKTARMRGQYSQGLALPLASFPELADAQPGDDVTDILGVVKWDPPLPSDMGGAVRGPLPSWITKTDEERVQNITQILTSDIEDWIATEKIDGSSQTYYVDPTTDTRGAASRNWDLLEETGRKPWLIAHEIGIHDLIAAQYPGQRVAVQGELFGPGIQSNPLKRPATEFAAFNLRIEHENIPRDAWPQWLLDMSVPVHDEFTFPVSVEQALADVETLKSKLNPAAAAEGIVWRSRSRDLAVCSDGSLVRASWKVISNKYLLKHDR